MGSDLTGDSSFGVVFVVFAVVIGLGIASTIAVAVVRAAKVRASGHNPFTLDVDLATRALDSQLLAPGGRADGATAPVPTIEQRLAELDRLHASGTITDDERAAARAAILRGA